VAKSATGMSQAQWVEFIGTSFSSQLELEDAFRIFWHVDNGQTFFLRDTMGYLLNSS
jgi:hypothetical protein